MESENKDILERNVSEKMCSSGSNGAGEICSPGTADTCGNRSKINKKIREKAELAHFWEGVPLFLSEKVLVYI